MNIVLDTRPIIFLSKIQCFDHLIQCADQISVPEQVNDEQAILESVEQGEWQSKGNVSSRIIELQTYLKQERKKVVSVHLSENYFYEIKRKSLENGIPYQNVSVSIHE